MFFNLLSETVWYPFLFSGDYTDIARSVIFWATVALILSVAISLIAVKGEGRKKLAKIWLIVGLVYACAVAATFLYLSFSEDGINAILFVPLLILLAVVAAGAVTLYFKRSRAVIITVGSVALVALIATIVCLIVYYNSGDAESVNGVQISSAESALLYVFSALILVAIAAIAFFFGKTEQKDFDSKTIAFAAICIAMSFALSYVRVVKLPQGGSITIASLLPIMLFSYMFGVRKGVFVGFIYGLLQAIQDPWLVHPAQFLLDYPVAFAAIGVAGAFANVKALEKLPQVKFALGAVLAGVLRFVSHIFSGVFAFSEYAAGVNPWAYSLGYNSFVFVDLAIVIVAGVLLFSSKSFNVTAKKYANRGE
ncbi:MAG: energy-coupled thiamine transporter ThiT [Clostridia bacterium]|nr:energy-coupled thiamine transporter ThiT [Clostridia bacterium]